MFAAMLVACCLYVAVLLRLSDQIEPHSLGILKTALLVFCLGVAVVILYVRFVRLGRLVPAPPSEELRSRLAKIRVHYILCYVLCETIAIAGFVVRFMGEPFGSAVPFFAAAFILFALCYPNFDARA